MSYYVICSIEKVGTKSQLHSQDLSPGFRKVAEDFVSGKLPIHKFPTNELTRDCKFNVKIKKKSNLLSQPKSQWRGPGNKLECLDDVSVT